MPNERTLSYFEGRELIGITQNSTSIQLLVAPDSGSDRAGFVVVQNGRVADIAAVQEALQPLYWQPIRRVRIGATAWAVATDTHVARFSVNRRGSDEVSVDVRRILDSGEVVVPDPALDLQPELEFMESTIREGLGLKDPCGEPPRKTFWDVILEED